MDLEIGIGIVCARCDTHARLGTASCASCGNALALEPPASRVTPGAAKAGAGKAPTSSPTVSTGGTPSAPASGGRANVPARDASPISRPEPSPVSSRVADKPKVAPTPAPPVTRSTKAAVPAATASVLAAASTIDPRVERVDSGAEGAPISRGRAFTPPKPSKAKSVEELMDQAKNFVCRSCSTAVPLGHKFCGRCGAAVPPEILQARTQFFGQLQAPGKAKLILIRGEGVEGLSYQLNAEQHIVGRSGQLVFPDDPFVSPKHANFFYRNGKLVVRDEGSVNGIYLRVKGSVDVQPGDYFLAGEQVFVLDTTPKLNDQPGPDGTFFYSSPKHQSPFRISQMLQGGAPGMTVCARSATLQIGREGGDLNFPGDLYMSAAHCKLEETDGKLVLTDLNSRNGTYVRLKAERELIHGDYLFIGRKLLRVEITAA